MRWHLEYVLAAIISGGMVAGAACKTAETAVIQGIDAVCTVAETQPEPGWVLFACSAIDAGGQVIGSFTAKVPEASAAQFKAKYVKKETGK